jgi:hypothetical protein
MQDQETRTSVDATVLHYSHWRQVLQHDYKTLTKVGHHNYRLDVERCTTISELWPTSDSSHQRDSRQRMTYNREEEQDCSQLVTRWIRAEESVALKELESKVNPSRA